MNILESVSINDTHQLCLVVGNDRRLSLLVKQGEKLLCQYPTNICETSLRLFFPMLTEYAINYGIITNIGYQQYYNEYRVTLNEDSCTITLKINRKTEVDTSLHKDWTTEVDPKTLVGYYCDTAHCPYISKLTYETKNGYHIERTFYDAMDSIMSTINRLY